MVKYKKGRPKAGETLLEKMFAEIMPNVTFVDATPINDSGVVQRSGRVLVQKSKKKISRKRIR